MNKTVRLIKAVFESMLLAWIWLLLVIIHIVFFSNSEPTSYFLIAFDKFVMATCFLLYPYALDSSQQGAIWPFFIQFTFWWCFGAFIFWACKKLK